MEESSIQMILEKIRYYLLEHLPKGRMTENKVKSYENLLAYLVCRKYGMEEWKKVLLKGGITLNHKAVMYSLRQIIARQEKALEQKPITPQEADKQLDTNKKKVHFHQENGFFPVMVTLDVSMLKNREIFRKLMEAGMNIARINCAHDDSAVWEEFIKEIKLLNTQVTHSCKIYMDLAGPKIRLGKFRREQKQLKIKIKNSVSQVGLITKSDEITTVRKGKYPFVLAVDTTIDFLQYKIGEQLELNDVTFIIVKIVDDESFLASIHESVSIDENSKITSRLGSLLVKNIEMVPVELRVRYGEILRIHRQEEYLGHGATATLPATVSVNLPKTLHNIRVNDRVSIDDGRVEGFVLEMKERYIDIQITSKNRKTFTIKEGKGINFPDSLVFLNVAAITKKDLHDLQFISKYADIIGVSFVHQAKDLRMVHERLNMLTTRNIPLIAKIETKDAVTRLPAILKEGLTLPAFGIMIARGDLAVEVGFEQMATVQEEILKIAHSAHIPVIWATQVLESLTKYGQPTRAEISDVYLGSRAQCIMLNKGEFIEDSVIALQRIQTHIQEFNGKNTIPIYS
ncbi:pyruvate kinase [Sutcliffiella rhizosphaerae]|uniref:Pyruvate kinase n=1 Tax=Sutcliffiella rhizosphaerae TaxID=2880967 RepID=A0ABN8AAT8_9BACI|nr:pyruvate kinase [Sutcliffiella rhizosphaerae]CAG9622314.1 hypothetical protein BACCIP111883_03105 [Sutcliffiella rhizosphaerae]